MAPSLDIAVVTTLYPSAPRPREGLFAERRWLGMLERGHRVRVLHPQPLAPPAWLPGLPDGWRESARMAAREERAGIAIERPRYLHLPGRALGNARRAARAALAALDRGARPELCFLDYAWPAAECVSGLARRGLPSIVSGRGSDVLQVAQQAPLAPRLARALREASAYCGVSRDLVRAMDELAQQAGRGRLVVNGVDTRRFAPASRASARAALELEAEPALVLVVGHLLALCAFERGAPPDARLAFLGRGPLRPELEREIHDRRLETRVSLLGERPPEELARWYAASDLLLLTSTREGRPNVVLEALASGRPVLATPAGGTAELPLAPDMLCDSREAGVLGQALAASLARGFDPAALAGSVAALSWQASWDALEALLFEVVEAARGAGPA